MSNTSVCVIFSCDEHQTRSSFRLIGVVYEDSIDEALKSIKEEWDYSDEDIETYIYVEYCELNDLDI